MSHLPSWDDIPSDGRFDEVLAALDPAAPAAANLYVVVAKLARTLGMAGVSAAAMSDDVSRGPLAWSNPVAAELEDQQFVSGEGPCIEAFERREVVMEPDLALAGRWPMFTPAALDLGVGATFAFPLGIGGHLIGALDLYQADPGVLDDQARDACLLIADVVAQLAAAVAGDMPSGDLPQTLDEVAQHRAVVHQAAGVTAVQLDLDVSQAMALMRARAWSEGRPLRDLADAIVTHELRLAP